MLMEQKIAHVPNTADLSKAAIALKEGCIGCKGCNGLCEALLEAMMVPNAIIRRN